MTSPLIMSGMFIALTLGITYWAARRSGSAGAYFAADRRVKAWQNGVAVAGDYMSAASFLGIVGLIAFFGFDGFMYSVGCLVGYLTVLLIVAEPLRNAGKYTMADVLAYRFHPRPVRAMASLSTLTINTLYMIAQMVGAGALVTLLLKGTGISFGAAATGIGILMIVYVVFGGMIATTWVQIIKALLLMAGTVLLSILVMAHFGFSLHEFFSATTAVSYHDSNGVLITQDFLQGGLRYRPPYGALELVSLGIALILGTAGLPHILVRFYTVPDARTARISVVWAMALIGSFYIMTTFLGFGAATIVGRDAISKNGGTNMSAPLLAGSLGGSIFFSFIAAVAFATILAVVAGLTISASTSFAHDVYTNVIHAGAEPRRGREVWVAQITACVVGAIAICVAIMLGPNANVAFLAALTFAVAASANLPVIVLSIYWKRFNTSGACWGLGTGLVASITLILISPSLMGQGAGKLFHHTPIFPLENPGILSVPLGFLGACLGTLFGKREPSAEEKFAELQVRANTGIGAETATAK
jgi:cation/acetate symporter